LGYVKKEFMSDRNTNFSSLDTGILSSKVYERLLQAIVRQELLPGQPLDVKKLADSFGVSRTPVHTAISRLSEIGLVEILPRKGTSVAALTTQDVHEIFEIRSMIEIHAVRKAVNLATDAELKDLSNLVKTLPALFSGDQYLDYYAFLERDRQFHSGIVMLSRNRRLTAVYDQARTLIEVSRASANKQIHGAALVHKRHKAIVAALMARDAEKAADVVAQHLKESEEAVLARLHFPRTD
jgi:DNA-binding GntR family transcriptional regulator